jgi:hypothetical protein
METFCQALTMSISSKPKDIKRKGTVQELKIIQTIDRRGGDTIRAEEVKTSQHGSRKTASESHSPKKRPKMETFDSEPIPFDLGDSDMSKKRQTLVLFLGHYQQ